MGGCVDGMGWDVCVGGKLGMGRVHTRNDACV